MKKIISAIIAVSILLSVFAMPSFAFSDIENSKYAVDINELNALGIMTGDESGKFNPEECLTRAEFAKIITEIDAGGMRLTAGGETPFKDVDDRHWGFPYIFYAVSRGYMNGYSDRTFRPDECITGYEVIKVLMVLSGYAYRAVALGGYPVGYEATARNLGVLNGITVDLNEFLYRDEIAKIINNTLDLKYVELVGVSENFEYKIHADKTLLSEKLGVKRGEGRVLANEFAAIGINEITPEGKINIDGVIVENEVNGAEELLGYNVRYMYRFDKDDEYNNVLISIENSDTKVLTVSAEDFISYSAGEFTYEDGDKNKTVRISQNADFIKNTDNVSFTGELFSEIKLGDITLISAKNSSEYDLAVIKSYRILVADVIDTRNMVIRDKFNEKNLELEEEQGKIRIIMKDGKPAQFSDIKQGDVLTVMEGKSYTIAYITSENIRGTIEGYDEEGITIDGKYLKRDYYSFENCNAEAGKNVVVSLDYFGNVAYIGPGLTEGENLGYIVKLKGGSSEMEDTLKVKFFLTDETFLTCEFHTDIILNGDLIRNINEKKLIELIGDENGYYNQAVKFRLADEKVKSITVARPLEELEATNEDGFCLAYERRERSFHQDANCYDFEVYPDAETPFMSVPRYTENAEERDFKVLTYKNFTSKVVFSGYTASKDKLVPELIVNVYENGSGGAKPVFEGHDALGVVSSVSRIVNEDGERVYKIHVFKSRTYSDKRTEIDLFVKEEDDALVDEVSRYKASELSAGDVIKYQADKEDYLEIFRMYREYPNGKFYNDNTGFGSTTGIMEKEVDSVKDGFIIFKSNETTAYRQMAKYENFYIILITDINGKAKVEQGTITDIVSGDTVIAHTISRAPMGLIVYK